MQQVWVIIPAYNEEKKIARVIQKARKYCKNIVVVDDGSRDSTRSRAEKVNAIVLHHRVNLGKGAALKTGCEFALKEGATKMIIMDGDDQHDPALIPAFLRALKKHQIVYGYRDFSQEMPALMGVGNRVINKCMRLLYNVEVKDVLCGFRAWTSKSYQKIRWNATNYDVETEIVARAARSKLSYAEVAVPTIYHDDYKGTTPIDGLKIVARMVQRRIVLA